MIQWLYSLWQKIKDRAAEPAVPYPLSDWSELPDEALPDGYERDPANERLIRRIVPYPTV